MRRAVYTIVGISFAYFIATFTWAVVWGELGRRISQKLQNKVVEKVLGLDQAFFDLDPLDITSLLVSDTQTIQRGTSEKVRHIKLQQSCVVSCTKSCDRSACSFKAVAILLQHLSQASCLMQP